MYTCIFECVCLYVHLCIFTCIFINAHECLHACICMHMHMFHKHVFMHACVFASAKELRKESKCQTPRTPQ